MSRPGRDGSGDVGKTSAAGGTDNSENVCSTTVTRKSVCNVQLENGRVSYSEPLAGGDLATYCTAGVRVYPAFSDPGSSTRSSSALGRSTRTMAAFVIGESPFCALGDM